MLSEEYNKYYQCFKGYLDKEWRKKEQCVGWLNDIFHYDVGERKFRMFVAGFNEEFYDGDIDVFIAHSNQGYLLTADADIILNSLNDDKNRGVSLLKRYYRASKKLANRDQIKLTPEDVNAYEVIMNMKSQEVADV